SSDLLFDSPYTLLRSHHRWLDSEVISHIKGKRARHEIRNNLNQGILSRGVVRAELFERRLQRIRYIRENLTIHRHPPGERSSSPPKSETENAREQDGHRQRRLHNARLQFQTTNARKKECRQKHTNLGHVPQNRQAPRCFHPNKRRGSGRKRSATTEQKNRE